MATTPQEQGNQTQPFSVRIPEELKKRFFRWAAQKDQKPAKIMSGIVVEKMEEMMDD